MYESPSGLSLLQAVGVSVHLSQRVITGQVKNNRNPEENRTLAFSGVTFLHSKKVVSNVMYPIRRLSKGRIIGSELVKL